jgi:hypothetical protein
MARPYSAFMPELSTENSAMASTGTLLMGARSVWYWEEALVTEAPSMVISHPEPWPPPIR